MQKIDRTNILNGNRFCTSQVFNFMGAFIFDCERMKHNNTGIYNYCKNLGLHLQKHLLPTSEKLAYFCPPGEKIFGKATYIRQSPFHKFFMAPLSGFDLWHATNQYSEYVPFRNRRIKVLLTIHDLNFMYNDEKTTSKKKKYLKKVQGLINRASAVVCISEYSRKDVEFYCDLAGKPLTVIHNGTNMLETPELKKDSYKPSKPFLFSMGVVTRTKNFHSLLPIVQQNDEIELVIAGRPDDQDYRRYILEEAERMGIQNNIRLLGAVSEPEKSWYLQNCCAFALPSLTEGFGLPVAEAMSAGKPIFLSNRTALPEIGSNAAFYFPDFSAMSMQRTFSEGMKAYRSLQMQEHIKQRCTDFCWDKAAKQYLEVYRKILQQQ